MILKSCILLVLVCAVKASVIITLYDATDGEIEVVHSLRSCDEDQCLIKCRNKGFIHGICLRDICRCTPFADLRGESEIKAMQSLRACDADQCDHFCHSASFREGTCVGNRCRCTSYADLAEVKVDNSLRERCNYQACDQLCRRLGFPGGACVGDKCKCDYSELIGRKGRALDYLLMGYKEYKALHSPVVCYPDECQRICQYLGYPGGTCDGNTCVCRKENGDLITVSNYIEKLETDDNNESQADATRLNDILRSAQTESCDPAECEDICRRLNHLRGICVGDDCTCY